MLDINFLEDKDFLFFLFCVRYWKRDLNKEELFRDIVGENSLVLIKEMNQNKYFYYDNNYGAISLSAVKSKCNDLLYKNAYTKIFPTKEYQNYLMEYTEYSSNVKKLWENNKATINKYLKKIVGKDYKSNHINFYLANPFCAVGMTIFSDKFALFGHFKGLISGDPNYELVYIVHECLHLLYPYESFCNNENKNYSYNIVHCIIQLITDIDLAISLNGKEYEGHEYLNEIKAYLLPLWQNYKQCGSFESLNQFIKYAIENYKEKVIDSQKNCR